MKVSSATSSVSGSYGSDSSAQAQRKERSSTNAQQPAAQERPEPKRSEERRPSPVVNTQGQTTGRIVNTSA